MRILMQIHRPTLSRFGVNMHKIKQYVRIVKETGRVDRTQSFPFKDDLDKNKFEYLSLTKPVAHGSIYHAGVFTPPVKDNSQSDAWEWGQDRWIKEGIESLDKMLQRCIAQGKTDRMSPTCWTNLLEEYNNK